MEKLGAVASIVILIAMFCKLLNLHAYSLVDIFSKELVERYSYFSNLNNYWTIIFLQANSFVIELSSYVCLMSSL